MQEKAMTPRGNTQFTIPVSPYFRWSFYFASLFAVIGLLGPAALIYNLVSLRYEPTANFAVGAIGILIALSWPWSMLRDASKLRNTLGLDFQEDFLYLHSYFRKTKISYSDIENVVFYPSLLNTRQKFPQQALLRIKSKTRNHFLTVPFYQDAIAKLDERKIASEINSKARPALLIVILLGVLSSKILIPMFTFIILIAGVFSKNGYSRRATELLSLAFFGGLAILYLSTRPLGKTDRLLDFYYKSYQSGNHAEIAQLCNQVTLASHKEVLAACGGFLSRGDRKEFLNYPKALEFGTEAVRRAATPREKKNYQYIVACSYLGMGRSELALQTLQENESTKNHTPLSLEKICN
jgi:hypothetical protein